MNYYQIVLTLVSIMRYSPDLRKRVLDFIQAGGSKTEAAKRFNVGRTTIYKWLNAPDPFAYQRPGPRGPRSIDYDALKQHIADFPDQTLKERAVHFGVSTFCILKFGQFTVQMMVDWEYASGCQAALRI